MSKIKESKDGDVWIYEEIIAIISRADQHETFESFDAALQEIHDLCSEKINNDE